MTNSTKISRCLVIIEILVNTLNLVNTEHLKMEEKLEQFMKDQSQFSKHLEELCTDTNNNINNLSRRFSTLENKVSNLDQRIDTFEKELVDCKNSASFLSDKYDDHQKKLDEQQRQIVNLSSENEDLKIILDNINNELEAEKSNRNKDSQYHRSSINVKILGIPVQPGEEGYVIVDGKKVKSSSSDNHKTREVIRILADAAEINDFNTNQVDVCHRIGNYSYCPIIIRFTRKQDRENFFRQRGRFKNIDISEVAIATTMKELTNWRDEKTKYQPRKDWTNEYPRLNVVEHLTNMNNELLKAASIKARALQYKFPGYVLNGEVRVKRTENSHHISINSNSDLVKIKND